MRLAAILRVLEAIAPLSLAESWDRVGLHVGDPNQLVSRALLCVDLTEAVMAEATREGAELVIAYHPPIFEPLRRLTASTWKERVITTAIRERIAIYSPHTALDAVAGGVTEWLAEGLGAGALKPITPRPQPARTRLAVALPPGQLAVARARLTDAGAETIALAHPVTALADGAALERVIVTCTSNHVSKVIEIARALQGDAAPAIELLACVADPTATAREGAGRRLVLDRPITAGALARRLKARLKLKHLELATPRGGGKLRSIAICPGAGGGLFAGVRDVDAYVTGEMRHHDVLAAVERGQTVALAGHTQTERPYLPRLRSVLKDRLRAHADGPLRVLISRADRAPSRIV
ncbi:MAG: Nif3-like dinuclear metal center hexameric protein [Myxococcales bacterium]|nr:Nif3-like dinuclear metal center hexameric protein [Myxococcales bacterium]